MDKVLKRRLIGASILIALAVIFVPMLLVDPDSVRDGGGDAIDVPPMPDSAREVRRIPLDPEAARVTQSERASPRSGEDSTSTRAPAPGESVAGADRVSPDEQIVLRPDLAAPEPVPDEAQNGAGTEQRSSCVGRRPRSGPGGIDRRRGAARVRSGARTGNPTRARAAGRVCGSVHG